VAQACLNLLGRNCLTLIETVERKAAKAINREQDFGWVGGKHDISKGRPKTAGAKNEICTLPASSFTYHTVYGCRP